MVALHHPAHHRVPNDAHAVGVRDRERSFQESRFGDPRGTRHFAVAVQRIGGGEYGIELLSSRQDCRNAGAHRTRAALQGSVTGDERGNPHLDAADVGDCVEWGRRPVQWDSKIARASARPVLYQSVGGQKEKGCGYSEERRWAHR